MRPLIDAYVDALPFDFSKVTRYTYRTTLIRYHWWCSQHQIPLQPQQHTKRHVRRFLQWLNEDPVSWPMDDGTLTRPVELKLSTIQKYWSILHAWYAWLADEDDIDESPMSSLKMPRARQEQPDPFDTTDLQRIVKALNADSRPLYELRNKAMVAMMLDIGLRASEVAGLDVDDVNLATGDVIVRHGKGDKERRLRLGSSARRTVRKYWLASAWLRR